MRTRHLVVCVAVLASCGKPAPRGPQWYEGGTLNRATLREWNAATPANRLATAADFVATIFRDKGLSMDDSKAKALQLIEAIRPGAEPPHLGGMRVSEVAASSAILMMWR